MASPVAPPLGPGPSGERAIAITEPQIATGLDDLIIGTAFAARGGLLSGARGWRCAGGERGEGGERGADDEPEAPGDMTLNHALRWHPRPVFGILPGFGPAAVDEIGDMRREAQPVGASRAEKLYR